MEIVDEAEEINPAKVERPAMFAVEATLKVDEADKGPITFNELEIVEEPAEINPVRLAKPDTFKVEDADNGPDTLNGPTTVDDPTETKPPDSVERLVTDNAPPKTEAPPTFKVEEADNGPEIFKELEIVDEAVEINPPERFANPKTLIVPVAFKLAKFKFPENNPFPCTANKTPGVEVPIPRLL